MFFLGRGKRGQFECKQKNIKIEAILEQGLSSFFSLNGTKFDSAFVKKLKGKQSDTITSTQGVFNCRFVGFLAVTFFNLEL